LIRLFNIMSTTIVHKEKRSCSVCPSVEGDSNNNESCEWTLCSCCKDEWLCWWCADCHSAQLDMERDWLLVPLKCSVCKLVICIDCLRVCYDCYDAVNEEGTVYCLKCVPKSFKLTCSKCGWWSCGKTGLHADRTQCCRESAHDLYLVDD